MRFVVLLFGFLGVALTACFGVLSLFLPERLAESLKDVGAEAVLTSPMATPPAETGLFVCLAAFYGLIGTCLGFFRCGWQGALLMLIPVICTSIMNPYTAVFTGLLGFTGLLSFLVFPVPIAAPQTAGIDDDED